MALTTVAATRARGGIDDAANDFMLFRLANDPALNTAVQTEIDLASAYLKDRVASTYYTGSATVNTSRDSLFAAAESLIALHFLFFRLKARKVFGTHSQFDSETSERYEELIDQELLKQAELLIEPYVTLDEGTPAVFALPAFTSTQAIDPFSLDSVELQIERDIEETLGGVDPSLARLP